MLEVISRVVVYLHLLVVEPQSQCQVKPLGTQQVGDGALVIYGSAACGSTEAAAEEQAVTLDGIAEEHLHLHGSLGYLRHVRIGVLVHVGVYPLHSLAPESDRPAGVQPLSESAHTHAPFPVAPGSRAVLDGYLLAQHTAVLPLQERVDVGRSEILVHVHAVAQILETGHIAHHRLLPVVLGLEAQVEQVPLVVVLAVVVHLAHRSGDGGVEVIALLHRLQLVGESALAAVLVVGMEVQANHL